MNCTHNLDEIGLCSEAKSVYDCSKPVEDDVVIGSLLVEGCESAVH